MDYAQKRGPERRENYCPAHEERTKQMNKVEELIHEELKPTVDRQTGQWRILMLVLVASMSIFIYLYDRQASEFTTAQRDLGDELKTTKTALTNMDKTVTGYMAAHLEQSKQVLEMIKRNSLLIEQNAKDINYLKDEIKKVERIQTQLKP